MTPANLRLRFRGDCNDVAVPSLWSDDEITAYMNWAIEQFCIGWGGFADASSSATRLSAVAGQPFAKLSDRILKIKQAWLISPAESPNFRTIQILNLENLTRPRLIDDYGFQLRQVYDIRPGPVYAIVLGMEPNKVRWINVPQEDTQVQMAVLRLPLKRVTCTSCDELEVPDEFTETILLGMKSQGYLKQDAETFDKSKAREFLELFNAYVKQARTTREARESKVRVVSYGGVGA
jgi:transcriptional antiterminator Rof (Rho-off)